jgi:hypothetical protein
VKSFLSTLNQAINQAGGYSVVMNDNDDSIVVEYVIDAILLPPA